MPTFVLNLTEDNQSKSDANSFVHSNKMDFFDSFKPIYIFSRWAGLMPFTIVRNANGEIEMPRVNKLDGMWFIGSLLLCLSAALYLGHPIEPNIHLSRPQLILIHGDQLRTVFCLISSALTIAMDMRNRFKLIAMLKKFTIFDKEIACLGVYFNFKMDRRWAWTYCTATFLVVFSLTSILCCTISDSLSLATLDFVVHHIPIFWASIIPSAISLSFIILLRSLYKRFAALNRFLKAQFLNGKTTTVKWSNHRHKKDAINTFQFIGRQYSCLTDIVNQLNYCYSFQVMIITGITFAFSVFTLYSFHRRGNENIQIVKYSNWLHFMWLTFFLIITLITIRVAAKVTDEGKTTSRIVHDISNRCSNADVMPSLTQFSLQVLHHCPVISCGLFVFDWTLLFTMGAAVVTYLMIMVNFE